MLKFIVICALVASAAAISKSNSHKSFNSRPSSSHSASRPSSASSDDVHAQINSYSSNVREDGFQYAFDTTNGIQASATGEAHGEIKGDFSWISPEGEHLSLQYIADENGYQPQGDMLPTPPPIPEAILKALEYIRTHPSYDESAQHSSPAKSYAQKPAKKFSQNKFGKRF
ncbi:larval cuticle protein 1-like [Haematobia irritans]|uniref:larval cuticle protein 1-like n=1 Tax=Haematobia irritans TaxID=7368 RepID=UPI003F4FD679